MTLTVELEALEVFGYHGVNEVERRNGQLFLFDVALAVPTSAMSDRIEDTVDYREVASTVREISAGRQFQLLEALAGAVAQALLDRFPSEHVRVRVRKPHVDLSGPVAYSAAVCELTR